MLTSVLVANRGEIAARVLRTARAMGLRTVAVHSDPDAELPYVGLADEAVALDGSRPADTYLNVATVIDAAKRTGAEAIHPGYGFLAENEDFARAVTAAGLAWVGPSPEVIEAMGNKVRARNIMAEAGVAVARGTSAPVPDAAAAVAAAAELGYPLMVKAAGGGGGIGMQVAGDDEALAKAFATAQTTAERAFGNAEVFLERYIARARHIEVQILGLNDGRTVVLGDRECSVQRRNQKVAEEALAPNLSETLRAELHAAAVRAGQAVGYRNAGTVECLVDADTEDYMFLEMNARIQVEHPVTEQTTGIDVVEQQLLIAGGEDVSFNPEVLVTTGHAIEFRVCAEDPKRFFPAPGPITTWQEPSGEGVRVDAGYGPGTTVTPFYDSLLAKLAVHGASREQALERSRAALAAFTIEGIKTNLPFLRQLADHPAFVVSRYTTGIVAEVLRDAAS